MTAHVSRIGALAVALVMLLLFSFGAAAQLAVSANDAKAVLVDGVNTVPPNPAQDTVAVIDLGASPPKVIGELNAASSVVGPPQSVAIAPDESPGRGDLVVAIRGFSSNEATYGPFVPELRGCC